MHHSNLYSVLCAFLAGTDRSFPHERWTQWMECPRGWAVAGLKTQVESSLGGGAFGGIRRKFY